MGWINRFLAGGFRKWKRTVEGMVKGDWMVRYRGEVLKGMIKGLVRKLWRRGFDRLKGEGGGEGRRERDTDDEYERFR